MFHVGGKHHAQGSIDVADRRVIENHLDWGAVRLSLHILASEPELLGLVVFRGMTEPLPTESRLGPVGHLAGERILVNDDALVFHVLSDTAEKTQADNCKHSADNRGDFAFCKINHKFIYFKGLIINKCQESADVRFDLCIWRPCLSG